MSVTFKIKRRVGGAQQSPTGGVEGELALYFPGNPGDTTKPSLYAHDGTDFRLVNPDVAITTQSVDFGAGTGPGDDIGAAYQRWAALATANSLTGNVVIGTFGTPKQAFVLTKTASPQNPGSWTSLGGAVQFATKGEITGGTNTTHAINPKGLGDNTVRTPSTPQSDDDKKYITLMGNGKINRGFLDVKVQYIGLGAGTNVGTAFATWAGAAGNQLDGEVVIADFGTPSSSYLLIVPGTPNDPNSWQKIGGAVDMADANEIHSGAPNKVVSADILRGETVVTPDANPANDADHLIRLNNVGKIDKGFLPASPTTVRPPVNPTTALVQPVPPYKAGDITFVAAGGAGTIHTSYAGAKGEVAKVGDTLLFDGTNWHLIPNETDLNAYIPLTGSNQITGNLVWAGASATAKAGTIIFNGRGGTIDNVLLDGGTY